MLGISIFWLIIRGSIKSFELDLFNLFHCNVYVHLLLNSIQSIFLLIFIAIRYNYKCKIVD